MQLAKTPLFSLFRLGGNFKAARRSQSVKILGAVAVLVATVALAANVISNVTSDLAAGATANTASISPGAGEEFLLFVASAVQGGETVGGAATWTISGAGLTWDLLGQSTYGSRRHCALYHGHDGTPSAGAVSLTFNDDSSGTPQEYLWIIDKVVGADGTTPLDSAVVIANTGATSATLTTLGTPDAGDFAYAAFAHTGAAADMTINSELSNEIAEVGGGSDVRRIMTGYDSAPDGSPTPGATWSGAEDYCAIGVIVNAASGGGGSVVPVITHHQRMQKR